MHINGKAVTNIKTNYNCYITAIEFVCLTNHMGSISRYVTPLVINSLRGRCTHTHTHTHTHTQTNTHNDTDICRETILWNQAHAGRLARLFKYAIYTNILQLASSDPSEQCITPSHTCALWIQAPELSHLNPSSAEHVVLSIFQNWIKLLTT